LNAKVENPKDKEPDVVTTTATTGVDDETSKVSGKETLEIPKMQSDTKVETPKEEEVDVATTAMAVVDDETSKAISKPQSDTKVENTKDE
jgi:hypothetical protein